MRMHYLAIGLLAAIVASSSLAQAAAPALPPATDTVAPEIAGVVKAGTRIEIVKFGLGGTDAGMGLSDGSVLVTSRGSLIKIDPSGNTEAFRAFTQNPPQEAPAASKTPLIVGGVVVAVVLIALIIWLVA